MAGTARPCDFIDGDALTKRPGGKRRRDEDSEEDGGAQPKKRRGARQGGAHIPYVPKPPGAEQRHQKQGQVSDLSVWDGTKYLKNRAGVDLCKVNQTGRCNRINSYNK